uniref:Small ribosomal subunit protein uS9c n=1 Tax=Chlorogonium capillatum TaxID=71743 RepID=A0A0S2ICR6_9CHLO|nr:ribosomal protein S9 [Chlorogonium capillatum]
MEILARGVGRRKEAVAQIQIVKGTGQFIINNIPAQQYLHNNTCSIISVKSPLTALNASALNSEITRMNVLSQTEESNEGKALNNLGSKTEFWNNMDTIVKVKGGGLVGQAEAIKLGLARALCQLSPSILQEHFSGSNDGNSEPLMVDFGYTSMSNGKNIDNYSEIRKQLKDKGYLTQDSRVKERRKYGLKKARKATQYNKR